MFVTKEKAMETVNSMVEARERVLKESQTELSEEQINEIKIYFTIADELTTIFKREMGREGEFKFPEMHHGILNILTVTLGCLVDPSLMVKVVTILAMACSIIEKDLKEQKQENKTLN